MNRPPLDWQDVAVQRPAKIEMDLWATASRQPAGRATPRALRSRPFGDHQAHGVQPIPITVNLSAIVGGGLLAWIPLVILIALYLGCGK